MNKLKLGVKGVKDMLSRDELKQIVGGFGSGGGSGDCPDGTAHCTCEGNYLGCKKPAVCLGLCGVGG